MNAILRDAGGKTIDYFTLDGHTSLQDANCDTGFSYDTDAAKAGGGEKILHRISDGTGGWVYVTAGSVNPTENASNDGVSATLDHYSISAPSTGLTCEPIAVTITGHEGDDTEIAPGSGTSISLSTSSGAGFWSNASTGSLTDNGSGNATYTFVSNSSVTLSFNHFTAATVNFNINSGGSPNEGSGSEDPNVTFSDAGFRFVDINGDAITSPQIADKAFRNNPSDVDPTDYYLEAVRTDDVTKKCVAQFANQSVTVQLAAECSNPSTCDG